MGTPRLPGDYEELVADVCRQFATEYCSAADPAQQVRVTKGKSFTGKSGHAHAIDVAVEFSVGGLNYLTAIECKHWNKSVGIDQLLVLRQRLDDIGAHKGVMVSLRGFQSGAIRFAASNGIALVVCRPQGGVHQSTAFSVILHTRATMNLTARQSAVGARRALRSLYRERFEQAFDYDKLTSDAEAVPFAFPTECSPLVSAQFKCDSQSIDDHS